MTEEELVEKTNKFRDEIETARCNQRLTQVQLARLAGVSPSVYSEVKIGTRNLTLRLAVRLLDALGLKIEVTKLL
jgi:transcriptional regulator with XRE-family HTH domain